MDLLGQEEGAPPGTCRALLQKAVEGDAEREARQKAEFLQGLPNIWVPDAEKQASDLSLLQGRSMCFSIS